MTRRPILPLLLLVPLACDPDQVLSPPVAGALRFTDLDAGYFHACGLTRGGAAYCWGGNSAGMLGDGTIESRSRPTPVAGARRFADIDAGAGHTCALDGAGRAWCWGHNDEGQLGVPGATSRLVPAEVSGGRTFVAISAGHAHTCALDADGDAWCWGDDSSGQLGDGPSDETSSSNVPVRVAFHAPFTQVRAGFYQSCGLTAGGAAWCWGSNAGGQNGDGTDSTRHTPVAVQGGHAFRSIAPGELFVCAVDTDDDVYCWGTNRWGELGEGPVTERRAPVPVDAGPSRAVSAASGHHAVGSRSYACALRTSDRISCWGGAVPALRAESPVPATIDGRAFGLVATGPQFVCALRTDGYAFCGGANGAGQLGTGDTRERAELAPVVGGE